MPGTPTTNNFSNIWQGPAKIFLNVALPAAGGRLTLFSDGTPDSTTSPNAVYLGTTKAGCKFTANQTLQAQYVDEYAAPFRYNITAETATLEGEFSEVLDFNKLALLLPNALKTTGTGFSQITSGGLLAVTTYPVAVIGPTVSDPTKFAVLQLYSAFSVGGLVINLDRKNANFSPFKFEGASVGGRANGDALFTFWTQT